MIEQNGETYASSTYAKSLAVSEAKVGKSCFLIASALGVLPWQKYGGIVDRPENLHVIALDANAMGGVRKFLESVGAPKDALKFNIYNMQEDVRRVSVADNDWDTSLYNGFMSAVKLAGQRMRKQKGVGMLLVSSLTGIAQALERAIGGPPGEKKQTMDMSKWSEFGRQLGEIRNIAQQDDWHCVWEGHVLRTERTGQGKEVEVKESMQISGKSGQNFAYNVEQVFRIQRMFGETHPGSSVDKVYLNTRPNMEFIAGGRMFTENLDPKEYDPTVAFAKLGLEVGRWNAPAKPKKAKAAE